ncbi:MAG: acetylglutamate kinase [Gemmatimonadetes bacterium 13_2_20CM_2_65_7]|nr:MAG: acetylglutamate kinase [Gemmatimonadetes bacterium 13_2_20CM_2_65_7]OLC41293.1 MAG: acetylglutamate kinase [Gemmatimonadetes bacterium 13_1_40CM_4_65_7]OLD01578.1 MAG: acetylglutamate kinase [Gemmatimonadetes bacterium 13_1_40CM_3_65_8]
MLTVRVVKIGGNQLDRPVWVAECARALKGAGPVVVVHGGGQAVSAWSRRLGLPVEKREGLRVTTPEIAEIVEMVLGGPMNRLLVSALRDAGLDAIGLSGVDGGLLTAQPVQKGSELGEVGTIENVRASLLQSLLLAGLTPVIAPVAPSLSAPVRPLNVNSDQAAAAIAAALGAQELLFVSDVPGVTVDSVTQPTLSATEVEPLIELGVASGGMAAKLRAAAQALSAGVRAVRIGDLDMFEHATAGTRLLATPPAVQPA